MRSLLRASLLILACGILAAACHHHHEHQNPSRATGATCPPTQSLTYQNFGKPFLDTYCQTCHGSTVKGADRHEAPSDHTFDTQSDVKAFDDHIDESAAAGPLHTNMLMPPRVQDKPMPTLEERRKLGEWLACGAP